MRDMSDGGAVERTEETKKLIETRYTFVICFVGVFRRLVIELGDTDFLKEQFKDLVTPSGIHPFTLDGHTGYVSCLTAVGDKVYPVIVIMPSEYGMLLLMSVLALCEGMLVRCIVSQQLETGCIPGIMVGSSKYGTRPLMSVSALCEGILVM